MSRVVKDEIVSAVPEAEENEQVSVAPSQVPPRGEAGQTVEPLEVVIETVVPNEAWTAGASSARGAAAPPTRRRRIAKEGRTECLFVSTSKRAFLEG
jgi:hypothetical protein